MTPPDQNGESPVIATGIAESAELESGNGWLDDFLPYQLYRVTNLLNDRLQGRLRVIGVNPSQWRILSVLRARGRQNLSRVVEQTLMEQPTVSKVAVQLEQNGLIDRRISTEDSRLVEVALTPKGLATFNEIVPSAMWHQRNALDGLSERDLAQLRRILGHIERNIALER